jgi:hypothetical protein
MTGWRTSLPDPGRRGFQSRALAMLVAASFVALGCPSSATKSAPPEPETDGHGRTRHPRRYRVHGARR